MKSSTKLLKLIQAVEEAKAAKKVADNAVKKAEEAIIKMMGDIVTTTVEKDGTVYTVTLSDNCRYVLTEDGKRKMLNEVPYDSTLWDKKPDVGMIQKDDNLKDFVIRKDFAPKVLITKKDGQK